MNVYGQLLYIKENENIANLLHDLDHLEMYFGPDDPRNEYVRKERDVLTQDSMLNAEIPVRAWVYVCNFKKTRFCCKRSKQIFHVCIAYY